MGIEAEGLSDFINVRCEVCGKTFEIAAEDAKGHYSKRCDACQHAAVAGRCSPKRLLFDGEKKTKQNVASLGMNDAPDSLVPQSGPPNVYVQLLQNPPAELLARLSEKAISVYIERCFNGGSVRQVAQRLKVSKSEVDRLTKSVELELLQFVRPVEHETPEPDREETSWEDTGWDFADLHGPAGHGRANSSDDYDEESKP